MRTPLIARRDAAAGGIAMLFFGGAAATERPASDPDAAIHAAYADYYDAHSEERRIMALPDEALEGKAGEAVNARVGVLAQRYDDALLTMAILPARTPAGIRAKAALVQEMLPREAENFHLMPDTPEIQIVLSLARDVLGRVAS